MPKVLIGDKLSPAAVEIFHARGIETVTKTGLNTEELIAEIPEYDGLVVRSACKPNADVIAAATNLKVIGRAGIGVDNIDIKAATAKGVVVMNTPFGNAITTAEHAIALMFAAARQIPAANAETQEGKWPKSGYMGTEVSYKTLGLIGCGNIGSRVAERAIGLKMKVAAYDPFLTEERAVELGVEKVELDELLKRADIITLHVPLTEQTKNVLSRENLQKTKPGLILVNCARGGLVDEAAVKDLLESGHIKAAAFDVFAVEPAKENVLFGAPNVICTPHLGAATTEAQENVALQVAEQMADYLLTGAVTNALNMPSISAEDAPRLKPFVTLAEQLGSFAGQLTETGIKAIRLEYAGDVAEMNTKALSSAAIAGVLRPLLQDVNMVSAPAIARERGILIEEVRREQQGAYENYVRLTVKTERQERSVAGTVFSDGRPRLIQIKGINMEAELSPHMLYITNEDQPGFIGALGMVLGNAGVNIATFALGRQTRGGDAIALVEIDDDLTPDVLEAVNMLPHVMQAKPLKF